MKPRAPWGSLKSFVAKLVPGQSIKVSTVREADNLQHRLTAAGKKSKWKAAGRKGSGSYLITVLE